MNTIPQILKKALHPILLLLIVGIVFSTASQVISRYIFGSPLIWTEELARYLAIWMVMLTTGLVLGENLHIGLDIITAKFPPKIQKALLLVSLCGILFFSIVLIIYGWSLVGSVIRARSAALRISMAWIYSAVPVGAKLIVIYAIMQLITVIKSGNSNTRAQNEEIA